MLDKEVMVCGSGCRAQGLDLRFRLIENSNRFGFGLYPLQLYGM